MQSRSRNQVEVTGAGVEGVGESGRKCVVDHTRVGELVPMRRRRNGATT
jgi:hypothetical protein